MRSQETVDSLRQQRGGEAVLAVMKSCMIKIAQVRQFCLSKVLSSIRIMVQRHKSYLTVRDVLPVILSHLFKIGSTR
jgi:hypothetical protein